MALGGALLRVVQTLLRVIQLCCAIVACGVFAYYLAVLNDHNLPIATYVRAVTGMSGAAIVYLAFAVVLTLCLAGVAFLGFIAIVLDIAFAGCFVAIAYFSRGGAGSCTGEVRTPLGNGPSDSDAEGYGKDGFGFGNGGNATYRPSLYRACKLETAVFAVSILAIFLFLITAFMQVLLIRHHKREKRYGPSPSNNYTSGAGRRPFWKRNRRNKHTTRDAELATAPGAAGGYGRPSHETGYTETTMVGGQNPNMVNQGTAPTALLITTATTTLQPTTDGRESVESEETKREGAQRREKHPLFTRAKQQNTCP